MRGVSQLYYLEAFIDTLSIFCNFISITLLFDNFRVFAYFWRTLKSMYNLVNLSVGTFIILCSGLSFANMSVNVYSDG